MTGSAMDARHGLVTEPRMKFRRTPIVIGGEQFLSDNEQLPDGVYFEVESNRPMTLEGPLYVSPGDWIIAGAKREASLQGGRVCANLRTRTAQ